MECPSHIGFKLYASLTFYRDVRRKPVAFFTAIYILCIHFYCLHVYIIDIVFLFYVNYMPIRIYVSYNVQLVIVCIRSSRIARSDILCPYVTVAYPLCCCFCVSCGIILLWLFSTLKIHFLQCASNMVNIVCS